MQVMSGQPGAEVSTPVGLGIGRRHAIGAGRHQAYANRVRSAGDRHRAEKGLGGKAAKRFADGLDQFKQTRRTAEQPVAPDQELQQGAPPGCGGKREIHEFVALREGKSLLVDQGEVLAACRAIAEGGITFHAQHTDREAADVRCAVGCAVESPVGQPHPHVIGGGSGKQPLAGKIRQIVQHLQKAAGCGDLFAVKGPPGPVLLRFAFLDGCKLPGVTGKALGFVCSDLLLPVGSWGEIGFHGRIFQRWLKARC